MSYNTTTIANLFSFLYASLRRVYDQYAFNFIAKQYFLFANVELKRPDRIPYYNNGQGAFDRSNPAGYLPTDISPYYFRERPVYFYNPTAFMNSRVGGNAGAYDVKSNPPYIILNLFLNGSYRDVYVNYDSSKMNLTLFAMDALPFVTDGDKIRDLQKVLKDVILQLSIAYNQVKLLEAAKEQGKYADDNFLYRSKYGAKVLVDGWISSLQKDTRFVVKVCAECNNNAQLGTTVVPITYIAITGAVSLTWLASKLNEYDQVKYYLDELLIQIERLRAGLDTQWKLVNTPGYKPTEQDVKAMEEATVTATKKKSNWWWWLLGGAGLYLVGNNNQKG